MRVQIRHHRWVGIIVLIVFSLGFAGWAGHSWAQQTATPTPGGFGPIITAPPEPTLAPGETPVSPTPTAPTTNTPVPTATPAITLTPTPAISPTPLPTYRADLMGIQVDPGVTLDQFDTTLWLAGRLGVKWLKFQVAWDILEPQQGVYSETYYAYRIMFQRVNQQNLNLMISVTKAPDWARASAEEDGPPRNPQDLANFITHMMTDVRADLYGNSYFDAIEVWNEPNLRREWNGAAINGAEYMRLFDAAYNAIRAGEGGQSVIVVTAGLAPTGINDGVAAVDDREYLRQMYAAGLANAAYQNVAIGVHPYGAANPPDARCCSTEDYTQHPTWFFLDTLEDYHEIMQQAGDTSRVLWATEFGWGTYEGFYNSEGTPAVPPVDPIYFQWITQDDQANYTMRAFEIGQSLPYVGVMVLWNMDYSNQNYIDAGDAHAAYALLRGGVDPLRPAFLLIEQAPKQ
ncbi:MAG: hypothetical protein HY866_01520 [Chloroflexi bacterium]|nr:hypothetical protein [Chloroflexota bacterium]